MVLIIIIYKRLKFVLVYFRKFRFDKIERERNIPRIF